MRLLFSILALLATTAVAGWITNGRLIANFSAIPANQVAFMQNAISNTYSKSDLYSVNSVEFTTMTNEGVISGWVMLDFTLSNKAAQVWSAFTNFSFPAGITGTVSLHMCAITNNPTYIPCHGTGDPTYFRKQDIP